MKKFRTLALAGAMTAAMVCSAVADPVSINDVKKDGVVVLDGTEATAPKMYQFNIGDFSDGTNGAISKITITGKGTGWADADWVGGGGGVGFNRTDEDGTWIQVDFNLDGGVWKNDTGVTGTVNGDDFTVVLNFEEMYAAKGVEPGTNWADGQFIQLGWWWGTNDTISISDIKVETIPSADATGDVAPIAFLAAIVAIAGIAMVASKKRA